MPEVFVVNASPLIVLSRVGRLELLRQAADRVVVPRPVVVEVSAHSDEAAMALRTASWLESVDTGHIPESIASWDLGTGESSVLAWALACPGAVAVLDDFAARKCALVVAVPVRGTLGLVLGARKAGRLERAKPVVEELRRAGLYLSDSLIRDALALVGE